MIPSPSDAGGGPCAGTGGARIGSQEASYGGVLRLWVRVRGTPAGCSWVEIRKSS
jgi:hypothetical protein